MFVGNYDKCLIGQFEDIIFQLPFVLFRLVMIYKHLSQLLSFPFYIMGASLSPSFSYYLHSLAGEKLFQNQLRHSVLNSSFRHHLSSLRFKIMSNKVVNSTEKKKRASKLASRNPSKTAFPFPGA